MKKYIIYAEWDNTKDNHAGMAHLCKRLNDKNSNYKLIRIPVIKKCGSILYVLNSFIISMFLIIKLRKGDKVILMEYLIPSIAQYIIARNIKIFRSHNKIFGLVHLAGSHLEELYTKKTIIKHLNYVDKILVLGSSLKQYFVSLGIESIKVLTTFHYVDTDYYSPLVNVYNTDSPVRVVALGTLKRDFFVLQRIVESSPYVEFDICMGNSDLSMYFSKFKNVCLHSFMDEKDLKNIMQRADVSLSVLKDTIGSNVITTSMAVGLAMLVSDVGSIRDYLDESNSILCNSEKDFVDALVELSENRDKLNLLKLNSSNKAKTISINDFYKWFEKNIQ